MINNLSKILAFKNQQQILMTINLMPMINNRLKIIAFNNHQQILMKIYLMPLCNKLSWNNKKDLNL